MGHQFGANHTFNAINSGACDNSNISTATAFEPGSGSTIMAYAGICAPQNVQNHSDDYYHVGSILEIAAYMKSGPGASCATIDATTSNIAPVVQAGDDYIIPANTPFLLTASGSDANGHSLTYCWEQYDAGLGSPNAPDGSELNDPLFRSLPPMSSPERYFPDYNDLLNNTVGTFEVLPTVARTLTFKVTARDEGPDFGCPSEDQMTVTTVSSSGFALIAPNGGEVWRANTVQEISWDVAGSNTNGIDATTVDIELSLDGGNTFAYLLASATPNDGSFMATLPDVESNDARIRIIPTNNIFYAISANNFTIERSTFTLTSNGTFNTCGSASFNVPFEVNSILNYTGTVNLSVASSPPNGTTASVSPSSITLVAGATESANLVLSGLDNLTPGDTYTYIIEGDDGTETKQINLDIVIGGEAPVLLEPADGISVLVNSVVFYDWEPVAEADEYEWRLTPVGSSGYYYATTMESSINISQNGIPAGDYFWRIIANSSACGTMVSSTTRNISIVSALPVEWLSFLAKPVDTRKVQLDWTVEQSAEHMGFEVERSTDGISFQKLAWVAAAGPTGQQSYRYLDTDLMLGGNYYYRLKQLDRDGSFDYSRVQQIALRVPDEPLSIHPNPARKTLFVQFGEGQPDTPYRIRAATGQVVQQGLLSPALDISKLASGCYLLELPKQQQQVRFIRE